MKNIWILLIFLAGALAPFQTAINARVGKTLHSPIHASMISFIGGSIALAVYILASRQTIALESIKDIPPYQWASGLIGAAFVTLLALGLPRLGVSVVFALVLAGQMMASLSMDHFGIMTSEQHSFTLLRLLGVVLIIGGVLLIKKF